MNELKKWINKYILMQWDTNQPSKSPEITIDEA
jgi:hypothetical protein